MSAASINKHHTRYFHVVWALEALEEVRGNGSAGSPPRVLDVGCGQGGITASVKKTLPHLEIYGCDNSQKQLETFRRRNKELGIKVKNCDAHKLSYEDNQFNSVLMIDVLEHLKGPKKALSEAARVVKGGGTFHLVVPLEAELTTFDGWIKKIFGKNLKEAPIGHINQFTLRQIKKMLNDAGFRIQKTRFSCHFSYQLFSLVYYFYVSFFRRGKYLSLSSKRKSVNKIINWLSSVGGFVAFVESSILRNVRGQTVHITARCA